MKQAWVRFDSWSDELAAAAIESGADVLVLPEGLSGKARALGRVCVVSPGGEPGPGGDVCFEQLRGPEDEARIKDLLREGKTVVIAGSWDVIPVENLVARGGGRLLLPVSSGGEIDLALGVLEKGVDGVVISSKDPAEVRNLVTMVKRTSESQPLSVARVDDIRAAGMGDRVCVDTCTYMVSGEGMLLGNSSGFLFLVQAETGCNPYVAPRPFRVNAGPVHSYIRTPGAAARYLSELGAGERVLVFGPDGKAQEATIGRVKIERRPLILIQASFEGRSGSILLQNAETVRLSGPDSEPVSVARLKVGDSVLIALEPPGRHFGMRVEETIREC
jgi:3-dehydroquinate synthase II